MLLPPNFASSVCLGYFKISQCVCVCMYVCIFFSSLDTSFLLFSPSPKDYKSRANS